MKAGVLSLAVMAVIVVPLGGGEEETIRFLSGSFSDPPAPARHPWLAEEDAANEARLALGLAYAFYRNLLSSQDGERCGFTPSCSRYAKLAIARHGLLRGAIMAADRLQRCNGRGGDAYPRDRATGKLYDPVP